MRRLCFVVERTRKNLVGGGEISLYNLIDVLMEKYRDEFQVSVVAFSDDVQEVQKEFYDGVTYYTLPFQYNNTIVVEDPIKYNLRDIPFLVKLCIGFFPVRKMRKILRFLFYHFHYLFFGNGEFGKRRDLFMSNFYYFGNKREEVDFYDEDFEHDFDLSDFKKVIQEIKPDVIHADNTRSILRLYEAGQKAKKVAVVRDLKFYCPQRVRIGHISGRECEKCNYECIANLPAFVRERRKRILERNLEYRIRALKSYDRVVTTSEYLAGKLRERGVEPVVIPNPVFFESSGGGKVSSSRSDVPLFVFVGMLQENKGPDIFVEAMGLVRKVVKEATGVICGRGSMEDFLRRLIVELDLERAVTIAGFLERQELRGLLRKAWAVVLPVRWPEPFGRVPLEAYLEKTPVICTARGGYRENVVDVDTGFLIEKPEPETFAERMIYLCEHPHEVERMGEKGLSFYKKKFLPEDIARTYAELYASVLESR